ncbi:hypothetical protein C8R45DRAFT_1177798 [Mycena sanguinolenta]|nr:hypothetical protein C8R45DRAFT_1177798 [Mycena sanguinolenta]
MATAPSPVYAAVCCHTNPSNHFYAAVHCSEVSRDVSGEFDPNGFDVLERSNEVTKTDDAYALTSFIGDSAFCGKICDQTGSSSPELCNDSYDRLGCEYNVHPTSTPTRSNILIIILGLVGTYTGANGKTFAYTQAAETDSIDHDNPTPVPTSSCAQFASAAIFGGEGRCWGPGALFCFFYFFLLHRDPPRGELLTFLPHQLALPTPVPPPLAPAQGTTNATGSASANTAVEISVSTAHACGVWHGRKLPVRQYLWMGWGVTVAAGNGGG